VASVWSRGEGARNDDWPHREPEIEKAVRAITGRLFPQLPARGRFHRHDFVEAMKLRGSSKASHRTGRQSAQLQIKILDKFLVTIETKN
jgi:hypothetical protein